MSGHSKWATTKRAKAVTDSKKAILFTKLARAITIATKEKGGDPETNFSLRLAIDKAKAANMPKENIERSIKRGTGELAGAAIEEVMYEGYGPHQVAIMVKCLTDNRNRVSQSVKHIFSRFNGSLGGPNSVAWQFVHKGVIRIDKEKLAGKNLEELELQLIDLGAQDIKKTDEALIIYTKIEDLQKVNKSLEALGLSADYSQMEYIPKETITIKPEHQETLENFFEALDDDEDVDDYYTNLS